MTDYQLWREHFRHNPKDRRPRHVIVAELRSKQAEQVLKQVPEPVQAERRYATSERERARGRVSNKLRKLHPKPESCQFCGEKTEKLHMHHIGDSFATLYNLGLHEDLSRHEVAYLCVPCHRQEHATEPIGRLLR